MSIAVVTGSGGLVGSEAVRFLHGKGLDVVGIDNNMRKYFFGEDGSTGVFRGGIQCRMHQATGLDTVELRG